jgi:hypothetical protein
VASEVPSITLLLLLLLRGPCGKTGYVTQQSNSRLTYQLTKQRTELFIELTIKLTKHKIKLDN